MKIRPIVTANHKKDYYDRDTYLCSVDLEQKKEHKFKGADGKEFKLYIAIEKQENHRISHPNYGTVEIASDGSQFKVGDTVIVNHFCFEDVDRKAKTYLNDGEKDLYKVGNLDLMFGVVDGEIICREGVLLCEAVEGKFIDTQLTLTADYEGKRRDIAKILKVWDGCEDFKVGEYALLAKGGDYTFTHEGKDYIKVDTYFDDCIATTDDPTIQLTELRQHVKHGEIIQL